MANSVYSITLGDLFTAHGQTGNGLVHDAELQLDQLQVEALVASGDCFVTLATEVDKISDMLNDIDPKHTALELEKLTRILLYLQQHYEIKPKTK